PAIMVAGLPVGDLFFGLVARYTESILDLSDKLVAISSHHFKIIVSQLTPLFSDLSLELFPITFDCVFIHGDSFPVAWVCPGGAAGCRPAAVLCLWANDQVVMNVFDTPFIAGDLSGTGLFSIALGKATQ